MAEVNAPDMVPLYRAATVLRVPMIRSEPVREGEGEVLQVVTARDTPVRGFIRTASEQVQVRVKDEGVAPFLLRPNDVLFSLVAPIGTMGLVPEGLQGDWVPGPHFALVRFAEDARDQAVALFAFFRQGEGRKIVQKLQADGRVRLLPLEAFARIRIPQLNDEVREWSRKVFQREPVSPPEAEGRPERGPGRGDRGGERGRRDRPGGDRPQGGRPRNGRPGGRRPPGRGGEGGGPRREGR